MNEKVTEFENEEFSGASLDTIEVPDTDLVVLEEMASPPSKDEEQEQAKDKDKEPGEDEKAGKETDEKQDKEQEELSEEEKEKQHKRDLYKTPRNKLVREWHEAHEQAAAQKARAELLEQELAEVKKAKEAEDDPLKELNERQQQLTDDLKAAADDADLEAYNSARLELDEINNKIMEVRFQKPAEKDDEKPAAPESEARAEQEGPHPAAQEWMDRNEWFFNPKHDYLAAYAQKVEAQLQSEGMRMGPKLYEKMDEILSEVPGYEEVMGTAKHGNDGDGNEGNEDSGKPTGKPKHLTAPSRPGNGPTKPKPGELSEYDKKTMRMAKLDPNNEQHKATYLKYKR
ncbi:MAG: hypothetical protein N0E44_18185 [Candidatus Thiodiazotropha lotti]|nr:hypothetical protein [Candidatus Thiodiazotropha lotti]MCW4221813.1 hypothetical protein [Candidatus Thiodiazotropha lotti]